MFEEDKETPKTQVLETKTWGTPTKKEHKDKTQVLETKTWGTPPRRNTKTRPRF